jgi:hypothetical protein
VCIQTIQTITAMKMMVLMLMTISFTPTTLEVGGEGAVKASRGLGERLDGRRATALAATRAA